MQENNRATEKKYTFIFVLSFILPFLAWIAGMFFNPSGWLTYPLAFSAVPAFFGLWAAHLWYISFPIAGFIIVLMIIFKKRAFQILSISTFLISIVYSVAFFMLTKTAEKDEFA